SARWRMVSVRWLRRADTAADQKSARRDNSRGRTTMRMLAIASMAASLSVFLAPVQAQISDDVVRIGVMNDQSGLYADITGQGEVNAVRLSAEAMGGSVAGKKIEVIFADNQNKPDIGSNIARQWYDQEGVDLIIVGGASSVTLAVQAV